VKALLRSYRQVRIGLRAGIKPVRAILLFKDDQRSDVENRHNHSAVGGNGPL
jgi:hypothetical protein